MLLFQKKSLLPKWVASLIAEHCSECSPFLGLQGVGAGWGKSRFTVTHNCVLFHRNVCKATFAPPSMLHNNPMFLLLVFFSYKLKICEAGWIASLKLRQRTLICQDEAPLLYNIIPCILLLCSSAPQASPHFPGTPRAPTWTCVIYVLGHLLLFVSKIHSVVLRFGFNLCASTSSWVWLFSFPAVFWWMTHVAEGTSQRPSCLDRPRHAQHWLRLHLVHEGTGLDCLHFPAARPNKAVANVLLHSCEFL